MFIGRHVRLSQLRKDIINYGINAAQVFTKPPQQWFGKTLSNTDTIKYDKNKYYICAHAGYLINLANQQSQSAKALLHEANRCDWLNIPDLVVHPGSGNISTVVSTLNSLANDWPKNVRLLLENTAGQGKYIGGNISDLEIIVSNIDIPAGICYDTAHAWGHGNSILDEIYNPLIKTIHLNDSIVPFGSKKDRHGNLGLGNIPLEIFYAIADSIKIPVIMETPEHLANEDLELYKQWAK